MHVLQLGPYPPPEGGVSRNMLAIRDALVSAGHACSIIAITRSSEVRDDPGVYRPRSPGALMKLIRTLEYDVLHLHIGGEISPRVLAMTFACTTARRTPKILTLHSGAYPETPEARSARATSVRGYIFRRFDRIIADNEAIANVFKRYGVSSGRVKVIFPYALQLPDENVSVPDDLRAFYAKHKPLLLAVGGLEPDYEPLFQIAAMKSILTQFPDAGLMIVGDGSMRMEVETAVAESSHADNICIAGNVEHAVTLHLIKDADIILRTTLFDGDAISVREALYLGTPVIATDNGMRPEGVCLIPIHDAESLVDKISQLANRGTIKKSAKSDDKSNITNVLDLYAEVLGGQASGAK